MLGQGPSSFNLDPEQARAKYEEAKRKQEEANLTQAQIEQKRQDEANKGFLDKLASPDAFEAWEQKRDLANAVAWDGSSFAKPQISNVDFNTVNGKDVSGPSRPAVAPSGGGADWGAGGISAAQQAPGIIANLGSETRSHGDANAKTLNSAAQFGQIGLSVGGPWGALIGAVVGGVAGAISNKGWYEDVLAEADTETRKRLAEGIKERKQGYIKNKTSDQLKAEADAYARALGYSPKSYNT